MHGIVNSVEAQYVRPANDIRRVNAVETLHGNVSTNTIVIADGKAILTSPLNPHDGGPGQPVRERLCDCYILSFVIG
jgi:hypothetical protein